MQVQAGWAHLAVSAIADLLTPSYSGRKSVSRQVAPFRIPGYGHTYTRAPQPARQRRTPAAACDCSPLARLGHLGSADPARLVVYGRGWAGLCDAAGVLAERRRLHSRPGRE